MSAISWIGDLIGTFGKLLPRVFHCQSNYEGVRFVRNRAHRVNPGIGVYWPITTHIELFPVVRQVLSFKQQVLMTACGETVVVSGVMIYSIVEIEKFLIENYDAEENLAEVGEVVISKLCRRQRLEALQTLTFEEALREQAQELMSGFGVSVESLRIRNLAKTSPIYLSSDAAPSH